MRICENIDERTRTRIPPLQEGSRRSRLQMLGLRTHLSELPGHVHPHEEQTCRRPSNASASLRSWPTSQERWEAKHLRGPNRPNDRYIFVSRRPCRLVRRARHISRNLPTCAPGQPASRPQPVLVPGAQRLDSRPPTKPLGGTARDALL
jgi:hypothetical protein